MFKFPGEKYLRPCAAVLAIGTMVLSGLCLYQLRIYLNLQDQYRRTRWQLFAVLNENRASSQWNNAFRSVEMRREQEALQLRKQIVERDREISRLRAGLRARRP